MKLGKSYFVLESQHKALSEKTCSENEGKNDDNGHFNEGLQKGSEYGSIFSSESLVGGYVAEKT